MTALVRLYPQAWRDRYEVEFLDVLADRPPSLVDRLDILLGAVDAHLDPEVPGSVDHESSRRATSRADRTAGGLAVIGGLLWIVAGIVMVTSRYDLGGNRDASAALLVSLLGGVAVGGAAVVIAEGLPSHGRAVRGLGVVALVAVLLVFFPWPIMVVGLYAQWMTSAVIGGFLMANGARIVGGILIAGSILVFGTNTENLQALLLVPYGLAWLVVGASLLVGMGWVNRSEPGPG